MVSLNGFMVQVPECSEETCDNYVVMQHGKNYSLKLSNHHKDGGQCKPCDADVYIDGKQVGSWRIPYGQNIVIERPVDDIGKFTAYKRGSPEAKQAQIDPNSSETGLVKVVFRPGTKKAQVVRAVVTYRPYIAPVIDPFWPWQPSPGWNEITCISYGARSVGGVYHSDNYASTCSCNVGGSVDGPAGASADLVGGGTGLSGESNQQFTEVEELDYDSEPATTIFLRLAFRENEARPVKEAARKVYSTKVPRPL